MHLLVVFVANNEYIKLCNTINNIFRPTFSIRMYIIVKQ